MLRRLRANASLTSGFAVYQNYNYARRLMMPMTEKELMERDAQRDIGAELLESVRQMTAGKKGAVHKIDVPQVVQARVSAGLSQSQFAALMGVSVRTLQDWEQGRRNPSGAAMTLLRIAAKHPDVIREVQVA
jgi:putative transcriptional regulator